MQALSQIKNNIIDKLNLIEDQQVIEALDQILNNLNSPKIQKLKKGESELIKMGLADYKDGNLISDDKVRKEEDSWLNE